MSTRSRKHKNQPYPAAVRESAVAAVREGLAAGRSLTGLAREMRLPLHTIQRWLGREARGRLRPVVVTGEARFPRSGGVVLYTARGHRIEGLDLAGAMALLRLLEAPA